MFCSPECRAWVWLSGQVGDQNPPEETKHHGHHDLEGGVEQQHHHVGVLGAAGAGEGDAQEDGEAGDGQHIVHASCCYH